MRCSSSSCFYDVNASNCWRRIEAIGADRPHRCIPSRHPIHTPCDIRDRARELLRLGTHDDCCALWRHGDADAPSQASEQHPCQRKSKPANSRRAVHGCLPKDSIRKGTPLQCEQLYYIWAKVALLVELTNPFGSKSLPR